MRYAITYLNNLISIQRTEENNYRYTAFAPQIMLRRVIVMLLLMFCSHLLRACNKQCKMPIWAIASAVLACNWSFGLVVFNADRNKVGPNTTAKLRKDILFSFSYRWILFLNFTKEKKNDVISKSNSISTIISTHFNKWSRTKSMMNLFWAGTSSKMSINSWLSSSSLSLLCSLNVSINRRYRTSLKRVSGDSRRNALKMPVTEWISTAFKSVFASGLSTRNAKTFFRLWTQQNEIKTNDKIKFTWFKRLFQPRQLICWSIYTINPFFKRTTFLNFSDTRFHYKNNVTFSTSKFK